MRPLPPRSRTAGSKTGDLGELSADGYLTLRGRCTDLIISGGFNVYPREIEEVLEEMPEVAEAAVAGRGPTMSAAKCRWRGVILRAPVETAGARTPLPRYACQLQSAAPIPRGDRAAAQCAGQSPKTPAAMNNLSLDSLAGTYLTDLVAQPRAVADTVAALAPLPELARLRERKVVLTGMGGSYHILQPLYLRLVAAGIGCVLVETSELLYSQPALLAPGTAVVVVSQSGRSAETVRLVERDGLDIVAVTNTAGSPLAERAATVIHTRAGEEAGVFLQDRGGGHGGARVAGGERLRRRSGGGAPRSGRAGPGHGRLPGGMARARHGAGPTACRHRTRLRGGTRAVARRRRTGRDDPEGGGARPRRGRWGRLRCATGRSKCSDPAALCWSTRAMPRWRRSTAAWPPMRSRPAPMPSLCECGAGGGPFMLPEAPARVRPVLELLPAQMMSLALAGLRGAGAGAFRAHHQGDDGGVNFFTYRNSRPSGTNRIFSLTI